MKTRGQGRAYGVYVTNKLADVFDAATLDLHGAGTYLPDSREIFWMVGELGPKGRGGFGGDHHLHGQPDRRAGLRHGGGKSGGGLLPQRAGGDADQHVGQPGFAPGGHAPEADHSLHDPAGHHPDRPGSQRTAPDLRDRRAAPRRRPHRHGRPA